MNPGMCIKCLLIGVISLWLPSGLLAQTIEEIVVTASRTETPLAVLPFAADVIADDDLTTARLQLGLDEALQQVPGLLLQNRYNYAQDLRISMRGYGARAAFGIRGIRVVVDGIPETLPDGQSGIDGIDLGAAARVEVLRGGAGALYGNAGGGVLLIKTQAPQDATPLMARVAAGADGYRQTQLQAAMAGQRGGVFINLSDLDYTGYRDHSAARNRQVSLRSNWREGAHAFNASVHHTDQPEAFDPGGINAQQASAAPDSARDANVRFNAGEALTQTRIGVRYQYDAGNDAQFNASVYGSARDFAARLPFGNGGIVGIDRRFSGFSLRWRQPLRLGPVDATLFVGGERDSQDDERERFVNNDGIAGALTLQQNEQVTATGAYAVLQVPLPGEGLVHVGTRFDDIQFDVSDRLLSDGDDSGDLGFREFSPMLGVSWRLSQSLIGYANVSRSIETPTTTELANPSQAGGFNPALDAQSSLHREIGLRWRAGVQAATLAVFDIDIDDELVPFELAAFPGRDFFANAGKSSRTGIEAWWQANWNTRWRTTLSYTWSDFRFDQFTLDADDFAGQRTPGSARHTGFAGIDYRADAGWFASAEFQYVGRIALNNANTVSTVPARLMTLRFQYPFKTGRIAWAPFVSVSNALDQAYTANGRINAFGGRYFEPGPDRAVVLGVSARFGE
ncbi:MAG: TonB-dependent receptor [Pseudomonadota bacterium]